jgi:dTDP-4-amino-4,6-dideoxygalactose transaminase
MREFSRYVGANYGVRVNSGLEVPFLALKAPHIGENSEVITISYSFTSPVDSIARCRAKPIFIDIEPDTYCMNRAEIENRITERTDAILHVHHYGRPANMEETLELGR